MRVLLLVRFAVRSSGSSLHRFLGSSCKLLGLRGYYWVFMRGQYDVEAGEMGEIVKYF